MAYEYGFAGVYDQFTDPADTLARAEYYKGLLVENGVADGILLDLACGTGRLSAFFIENGYDVISVDGSEDMLAQARELLSGYGARALLLKQDMRELDLYGTVRACVCATDSVNHLTAPEDVLRTFARVSLFLEPGGVFVFDVNTVYKHKHVLSNNTFVYEDENDFLVWQNEYDPADDTVHMLIDVFSADGDGRYIRYGDEITERAYSPAFLKQALTEAGFRQVEIYNDLTRVSPPEDAERICIVAKK
jgi:ubiquinone/menaquinone biosynthesis C-methylase UbiE